MAQGQVDKGGKGSPQPRLAQHDKAAAKHGLVWDPLVRLTHWAVVAAVLANYFLNKSGGLWHVWIGWGLMAVLAMRFGWGFFGPREARFSSFVPNPMAALRHLIALGARVLGTGKALVDYPSHNPAGAIMAYTLWAMLGVVTLTGLVMTDGTGPIALAEQQAAVAAGDWSVLVDQGESGETDDGGNDWAEDIHEVAANLVVLLALAHVLGVVLESRAIGRNLVRAMLFK